MTSENFKNTLIQNNLPSDISALQQALWHDAKGSWEAAHEIAQSQEGTLAFDQLHAYLHRKEGDRFNANYWYNRCGASMPTVSLQKEWEQLVEQFCD